MIWPVTTTLAGGFGTAGNGFEYKTASADLIVEADSCEIQLNGVAHWLAAPVSSARGELWATPLDVLKTIDPILRHGGRHSPIASCTVVLDPGTGATTKAPTGLAVVKKT